MDSNPQSMPPSPSPEHVNSADEALTAVHPNLSSGQLSEDSGNPHEMNAGAHKCSYTDCNKKFPTKQGLVNHSRIHFTDEQKILLCPHPGCERRYTSKNGFNYHYGSEHGDRSTWHQCPMAECLVSFYEPGQLKLHQLQHGVYCCTAHKCDYQCYSEEELFAHRDRNHSAFKLHKDRVVKAKSVAEVKPIRKVQKARQRNTGRLDTMELLGVGSNQGDEEGKEDKEPGKDEEREYDGERNPKKPVNYGEIHQVLKGWKCPIRGCKTYRKFKFDLHTHWQDKHPNLPEPSDIASMVSSISVQSAEQNPTSFLDDSHWVRVGNMEDIKEDYDLPSTDVGSEQPLASNTLGSTPAPVHRQPALDPRTGVPNNTVLQRPTSRFKREVDDSDTGNHMTAGNMNSSDAKATTQTTSTASSHSSAISAIKTRPSLHNTTSSYNPSILAPRHGAGAVRPSLSVSVTPFGNPSISSTSHPATAASAMASNTSSISPTNRAANNPRTENTISTLSRPVRRRVSGGPFNRATEARRLNPPLTRSNKAAYSAAFSTNTKSSRNQATNSPMMTGALPSGFNRINPKNAKKSQGQGKAKARAQYSSHGSSPLDSDDDDQDDEEEENEGEEEEQDEEEDESLFVSPIDDSKTQQGTAAGSNSRVLGVRGFANMPLPRDQDSDEEDMRPSHILRQERRAAAGRSPYYPPGARDRFGRPYGRTMGTTHTKFGAKNVSGSSKFSRDPKKTGKKAAAQENDSDDDDDEDEFDDNFATTSSGDSSYEAPRRGRRSIHHDSSAPSATNPRRPSTKTASHPGPPGPPGPPRTPSPDDTKFTPYQVYRPDFESPPPSYLIKSPGVIDRRLPYVDRPDNKFLSDVGVVQPEDLFDADDIFFCFRGPTPRETELQQQFDAEREQMRLNAIGSGFRAPMRFDTCPHTAPVNRLERKAWVAQRLRLDELELRADDDFEDEEKTLGLDRGVTRHDQNLAGIAMSDAPGSSSALPSKKKATCAGPARVKRKYIWKDQGMKNKRSRGGVRPRPRPSRGGGDEAQVDGGADEQVGRRVAASDAAGPDPVTPKQESS
ncbi:hypothetical protein DSL72_000926 [Monilinia vaccinii-corymbosi]|uniref:C2H2-type domain-containing protein n=1 Tax=Monilinia vaccinii-corymbosi TaxID=61207 RepID=A0A8A3P721_9HELO|nr:hypothetical protein DSL72_000926 [Monilinia vaccinii-corymbosi]